jgi:hypothetical protein
MGGVLWVNNAIGRGKTAAEPDAFCQKLFHSKDLQGPQQNYFSTP